MFSVVIPTYNRAGQLKEILINLENQIKELPQTSFEVIITDDSTNEQTKTLVERDFQRFVYTKGPQKGPAANRNHGASISHGSWIIFFDDDIILQKVNLPTYVAATVEYPNVLAFEGAIKAERNYNPDTEECPENEHGGCFWSANIMVNRALFFKLGGFDEFFPKAALEDQDFYLRIQPQTTVMFLPSNVVVHPIRKIAYTNKYKNVKEICDHWVYFVIKNQKALHLNSKLDIIKLGYRSHIRNLILSAPKGRFRQWIYSLFMILIGMSYINYVLLAQHGKKR